MYTTYVTYALLLGLLIWGGKFAGFKKGQFHSDSTSLDVTKSLRGFAALGVYLTFLHDYDYVGTAALGRTFGVMSLICVPMLVSMGISHFVQSSRQRDLGKFYKKEAERFKLHISPTINFEEPGGGLLLQLGF